MIRKLAVEFLGTAILVFFAVGVATLMFGTSLRNRFISPTFIMNPGFHCVRTHWIRGFITRDEDADIYTALLGGLVNQQLANDPGGQRWRRLIPRVMTMFADDLGLP